MTARRIAAVVFAGLAAMSPASAHPHVWVTVNADITFNNSGQIDGINQSWTFDDAYTKYVLDGLDANGDGVYGQDELGPLTQNNLAVLRDYDFFTAVRVNGDKQKLGDAADYGQIYSGDKLEMHFHLPLTSPIDPRTSEFVLRIYDPDYFVDLQFAPDDPVTAIGPIPKSCRLAVKPLPTSEELDQTRAMLATKGKDWKPENGEDFGSMFAQPVVVTCS